MGANPSPEPSPFQPINFEAIDQEYKLIINKQTTIARIESLIFSNTSQDLNQLACYLYSENKQFFDKIVPYQKLMPQNICKWNRAEHVFIEEKYGNRDWTFQFVIENKNRYTNLQVKEALVWLKQEGKNLLHKICLHRQQTIFKPGMYRFMFCVGGKKNVEIVVDSYIPIDNFGRYLFDQPQKGGGIWSILLLKALAKVFGSYLKVRRLKWQEIVSQITGYPSPTDYPQLNVINTDPITLKRRSQKYLYYQNKNHSYIEFILSFWFELKTDESQKYKQVQNSKENMIIQIFEVKDQLLKSFGHEYQKIQIQKIQSIRQRNILKINAKNGKIIKSDCKALFIYFFNLSYSDISCNFVTQSNIDLFFIQIKTSEELKSGKIAKMQSLKNQYSLIHNQLQMFNFRQYRLRCYWNENRGILCLKNTQPYKQIFSLQIKQQFRQIILLQDKQSDYFTEYQVQANNHCMFILKRVKKQQYSTFYKIYTRPI